MALVGRKISSFPVLGKFSGEEYIMVAYAGKSYKIPVSMLTGNAIRNIEQKSNPGDNKNNPITFTVGTGEEEVNY